MRSLLQEKDNLRYFFIVLLWDKLYLHRENNLQLLKTLNLVRCMGPFKETLSAWLDDFPRDAVKLQVRQLLIIM